MIGFYPSPPNVSFREMTQLVSPSEIRREAAILVWLIDRDNGANLRAGYSACVGGSNDHLLRSDDHRRIERRVLILVATWIADDMRIADHVVATVMGMPVNPQRRSAGSRAWNIATSGCPSIR